MALLGSPQFLAGILRYSPEELPVLARRATAALGTSRRLKAWRAWGGVVMLASRCQSRLAFYVNGLTYTPALCTMGAMDMNDAQRRCFTWLRENYGDVSCVRQTAKVVEEVSEVVSEMADCEDNHVVWTAELFDEIGDLFIATMNLCSLLKLDVEAVIDMRMETVLNRKGPLTSGENNG